MTASSEFDRKTHWENVYTRKSPLEVSWYQVEPVLSLELVAHCALAREAPIIDVGGGASVLVDRLRALGYRRLAVLDISAAALHHAQSRLGTGAADIEWFEADIMRFVAPHAFQLWHDRAVLHFLTDPGDRRRYVQALMRAVPAGGHVIIGAFAIGGPTRCSDLDIVQYDAAKLGAELGPEFVLREEVSEVHITPAHKEQAFAFFRFLRRSGG